MAVSELQPLASVHSGPSVPNGVGGILYAVPEAPRDTPPSSRHDEASETEAEPQQAMVLIAEDEETIADTLAMVIEDAGYVPVVAHDGREALALARQHHPQLIITDLMMPFLNGADLIAAVRRDAAAHGAVPPPVVVVTAASRARAEEAGADVVIVKPFDVTKIEAAMRQLLGQARQ